jgi:predicted transcriptional regulator
MTRSTKLIAAENRLQAMELRKSGLTLEAISYELGVSTTMVHKYLTKALAELAGRNMDEAEEFRALQVSRLEGLLVPAYTAALEGDLNAVEKARKVIDSLSDLMGCKAPQKVAQATINLSESYNHLEMTEEEIDQRLAELEVKLARPAIAHQ